MNSVVLLDPRNKALFASFYVEGLRKMFGSKSLRYSMLPLEIWIGLRTFRMITICAL